MRILHITSLLPAPIASKKSENKILFRIAENHEKYDNNSEHFFIYVQPFTLYFLSFFKSRWREYYSLQREGYFLYEKRKIFILSILKFKFDFLLKPFVDYINKYFYKTTISRVIYDIKPDVIHCHSVKYLSIGFYILKKHQIPYILTLRGKIYLFYWKYYKKHIVNAKYVHSVNVHKEKYLKSKISEIKTMIIPHPVEEYFFKELMPKNEIDLNRPIKFITISRLLDWKNIDLNVESFNNIKTKNFIYHIYGDGPEINKIWKTIKKYNLENKIKLMGTIEHNKLPDVLSKYDVFMLLSYPETFGIVYIEAMACGLPIICTENSGVHGLVSNDCALFVKKGDYIETTKAIQYFLDNPHEITKMGKLSKSISYEYSWDRIVAKYHKLYSGTINTNDV